MSEEAKKEKQETLLTGMIQEIMIMTPQDVERFKRANDKKLQKIRDERVRFW